MKFNEREEQVLTLFGRLSQEEKERVHLNITQWMCELDVTHRERCAFEWEPGHHCTLTRSYCESNQHHRCRCGVTHPAG